MDELNFENLLIGITFFVIILLYSFFFVNSNYYRKMKREKRRKIAKNEKENSINQEEDIDNMNFRTELREIDEGQNDEIKSEKEEEKQEIELTQEEIDNLVYKIARSDFGMYNECDLDLSSRDSLFEEAAKLIVNHQQGSTSLIQRKFMIGYNRAGRIMDQLEVAGIIGPFEGSKARQVFIQDITQLQKTLDSLNFNNKSKIDFRNKYAIEIEIAKSKIEEEENNRRRAEREFVEKEIIRQELLEKERKKQLRRQVKMELIGNGEMLQNNKRISIPQDIQDSVWNRDGGKCVLCGSQENLEFDHIIPISKGGATTYRNLQLLCQNCNRSKSDKIG